MKRAKARAIETEAQGSRNYLSQSDVPSVSIQNALRVARAISDNYGGRPTRPVAVAQALEMTPTAGTFRTVCGAAIAYGLTEGGYGAGTISLTALGRRIVKPTVEGDEMRALREAVMLPRVVAEFLKHYDGSKLPKQSIALNVLEDMGVPATHTKKSFDLIVNSARDVGFIRVIKSEEFVDLSMAHSGEEDRSDTDARLQNSPEQGHEVVDFKTRKAIGEGELELLKRVYITHGKNRTLVPQLSELLSILNFEGVVSQAKETVSIPLNQKVLDDMRSCGAAIIHIDAEKKVLTPEGETETILNQNVLIEIGRAEALYGQRFILLVQEGVTLPSNIVGLYEVRYQGEKLDAETTIKLLKAFGDLRNRPLPSRAKRPEEV